MEQGWIKLHRSMLNWEWYDDSNTFRLFLHLLLNANHKENKWRGHLIKKGERLTSQAHLAEEIGLSINQIRLSISKLKSTGEITVKTTNKYSLIKVNNWDKYQQDDRQTTTEKTDKPNSNQIQTTTNNNDKKEKNDNNFVKKNKKTYKDFDVIKLNDGTVAKMEWGKWVDQESGAKLDRNHYKELP